MYRKIIKPLLDLLVAVLGLGILSPLFLLITVFLFFSNQGKPFFLQSRPGRQEKLFAVIKFRTMTDLRDSNGNLLPDSERLKSVGKCVRGSSLDELPQLINVLKGNMSLIGPRPLLPEYVNLYDKYQARRHEVRPGITGWAQVNGRNFISWEERFKMDVWYVDNMSFKLDLKILFLTVQKVIKREGINSKNAATMERFMGN